MQYNKNKNYGFTLVETLVGIAVFLIVSIAAYNTYIGLFKLINVNKYKLLAINLANEQFEIAKNMPYKDIGIVQGIPVGLIPRTQTLSRGGVNFTVDSIFLTIESTVKLTPPLDNVCVLGMRPTGIPCTIPISL